MTREQIEDMIGSSIPFTLLMADGREYHVPHRDYIFLPPKATAVVVADETGHFYILPLRTMTGLKTKQSP
jgi:hypothetical protein